MKFSIIVPVYNVEQYIEACLESIYKQSFSDYEVIIINDGTKDNSANIVRDYIIDKPNFNLYEQPNQGLSATRNNGVKLAQGDYILFLDSDDSIFDNRLQQLSDFLDANPVELCLLTWLDYYPDNAIKLKKISSHKYFNRLSKSSGKEIMFTMLKNDPDWQLYAWAMCYEREFYLRNNLEFVDGIYFEDMIFNWQALLAAQSVDVFTSPFIRYLKTRKGQITSNLTQKNILDRIVVSKYWVDHVDHYKFTQSEKYRFLCRISSLYFSAIIFVGSLKPEEREEVYEALYGPIMLLNYASNAGIQSIYTIVKKVGFRKVSRIIGRKILPFHKI